MSAMNNGSMAYMGAFFQYNRYPRKHVDGAIFLNITSILNYDFTEIPTNCGSWTYINILANNHISNYCRKRMDEGTFVYYWFVSFELINHCGWELLVNCY